MWADIYIYVGCLRKLLSATLPVDNQGQILYSSAMQKRVWDDCYRSLEREYMSISESQRCQQQNYFGLKVISVMRLWYLTYVRLIVTERGLGKIIYDYTPLHHYEPSIGCVTEATSRPNNFFVVQECQWTPPGFNSKELLAYCRCEVRIDQSPQNLGEHQLIVPSEAWQHPE